MGQSPLFSSTRHKSQLNELSRGTKGRRGGNDPRAPIWSAIRRHLVPGFGRAALLDALLGLDLDDEAVGEFTFAADKVAGDVADP